MFQWVRCAAFWVAIAMVGLSGFAFAGSTCPQTSITRFHCVADGIYRGARPSVEELGTLKKLGIRTDINLQNFNFGDISEEEGAASDLRIHLIEEPMNPFQFPDEDRVNRVLALLSNPSTYPVYVHCTHGKDRTGLVIGLYRVEQQGWTPTRAYQEMLSIGFDPSLTCLDYYYKKRTRFPGFESSLATETLCNLM